MLADLFGPDLLIVAIILVVLLFGGAAIPKLARNLGSAKNQFEKGLEEGKAEGATTPPRRTRRRPPPRRRRRAPEPAARTGRAAAPGGPCHLTSSPSPTASGTARSRPPPSTRSTTSAASSRSPTVWASAPPSPTSPPSPPGTASSWSTPGSAPLARVVHDDIRTLEPGPPRHRRLLPRAHRPRLRRAGLGGGGRGGGLGRSRGHRAPRAAGPLRPLHLHRRLQHHHQPPAVRLRRPELAHRVPLPRPDLPRHAGHLGRWRRVLAAPREGRDRRPHRDLAGRHPGALLRRPLHLGLAQRRQPAEGAALPEGVGRRPPAHARGSRPSSSCPGTASP